MADIWHVAGKHFPNCLPGRMFLMNFIPLVVNPTESSAELECSLDIFDSDIKDDEDDNILNSTV